LLSRFDDEGHRVGIEEVFVAELLFVVGVEVFFGDRNAGE